MVKIRSLWGNDMNKYYYYVNTFQNNKPVQKQGYIEAESEEDAIQKLIDEGIVSPRGYEFLELYVVENTNFKRLIYDN